MGLISNWLDNRKDVKLAKIDAGATFNQTHQAVAEDKFKAFEVGYANGIDPRKAWADSASSMTNSVASAATSIATKGQATYNSGYTGPGSSPLANVTQNPLMLIVLVVLGLLMLSKK